ETSIVKHPQHLAALALVLAGNNDHFVIALDFLHTHRQPPRAYRTSGAREIIFMNFSPRSSRVTGPKMRVPIGANWLLSNTAALTSNLKRLPSWRRMPFLMRTCNVLIPLPIVNLTRTI